MNEVISYGIKNHHTHFVMILLKKIFASKILLNNPNVSLLTVKYQMDFYVENYSKYILHSRRCPI